MPKGMFCVLAEARVPDGFDVLFIQIAVEMTKYMVDVVDEPELPSIARRDSRILLVTSRTRTNHYLRSSSDFHWASSL